MIVVGLRLASATMTAARSEQVPAVARHTPGPAATPGRSAVVLTVRTGSPTEAALAGAASTETTPATSMTNTTGAATSFRATHQVLFAIAPRDQSPNQPAGPLLGGRVNWHDS